MESVDRMGPTGAPMILFIHGAGISRKLWQPQLEALSDDFRTVAPDLPGHGGRISERFDFNVAVETVERHLAETEADCVVLVGQSLGGYVASEVATRNPERVTGLVLSGSSAEYRGWLGLKTAVSSLLFRLGARSQWICNRFVDSMRDRLYSRPITDQQATAILDTGISLDAWGQSGRALVGFSLGDRLSTYPGPVLLLNGADDRINRPAASERRDEFPQVRTEVIADAGHTVNLERPRAYTEHVRSFVQALCEQNGA